MTTSGSTRTPISASTSGPIGRARRAARALAAMPFATLGADRRIQRTTAGRLLAQRAARTGRRAGTPG